MRPGAARRRRPRRSRAVRGEQYRRRRFMRRMDPDERAGGESDRAGRPGADLDPDASGLPGAEMTMLDCSPHSPFRPTDWRDRRAIHLDAGRLDYRPRREDARVRLALQLVTVHGGIVVIPV